MSEILKNNPTIPEFILAAGEKLDLDQTLEAVRQNRLVRYRFEDGEEVSRAANEVVKEVEPRLQDGSRENIPHNAMLRQRESDRIWQIFGNEDIYKGSNGMMNHYVPGDVFHKHTDFTTTHYAEECTPAEMLTFLYVASGSKEIWFYLDGDDSEPTRVTQQPGELYVFQGGSYSNGNELFEAVPHEVPAQDTHNTTITWELSPANPPHRTT